MTIDKAIAHAREAGTIHRNNDKLNKTLGNKSPYYNIDCLKYAEEYEQLAEWLEELKMYKSLAPKELVSQKQRNDRNAEYHKGFNDGYNKAIDDFLGKCKNGVQNGELYDFVKWNNWNNCACEWFEKIAEQLKEGGTDE